ncbi:hypothetical protein I302_100532 [Kwoniella bestiolae CBS 10118]|uniref:ATP-dependent RNA helicase n=1 Tax=Kwoniella bestiolae CBS 10118 TaxID=1296100 RepID=A0A1B9G5B8_9TREE|nr:hypothetical protein I302_03906 [Kwoniella bestiolae CBS 10118]OCF26227.1 hypothetical protein I302_03906 [Kwoniella bestiolae CBS 10118]
MLCRACLKVGSSAVDRPTSSKIGARVFSRYLSTIRSPNVSSNILLVASTRTRVTERRGRTPAIPFRRYLTDGRVNSDAVSRWTELGISPALAERFIDSYPHIIQPTPAQKIFLLAVGAGKEVYLKDDMGRGKTLALALSAMNIALESPTDEDTKVIIIVPTPHLAQQTHAHLLNLSPVNQQTQNLFALIRTPPPHLNPTPKPPLPNEPILIATPTSLSNYSLSPSTLPSLRYIYLDEPEHLIGPIPSRSSTPQMLRSHPLFRHPPPIITVLNDLLNIQAARGRNREEGGVLDYSARRDGINTIWVSSGINKDLKRLIKMRGWVRRGMRGGDGVVDLDFTEGASEKLKSVRKRLLDAVQEKIVQTKPGNNLKEDDDVGGKSRGIHEQRKPEHYVLVIDPSDGSISSLDVHSPSSHISPEDEVEELQGSKRKIPDEMIETLSLIHATSPSKGYSLVLPPEGISLNNLSESLSELGIPSLILTPYNFNMTESELKELQDEEENGGSPLLLGTRSSIPGLHLPQLTTIYLLDGLDVRGLSRKQRKVGGVGDRVGWYTLVKGRLGRLGTDNTGHGRERQRVVSLVMGGTEDEKRLKDLFGGEARESGMKLSRWDMKGLEEAMEREFGGEEEGEEEGMTVDREKVEKLDGLADPAETEGAEKEGRKS